MADQQRNGAQDELSGALFALRTAAGMSQVAAAKVSGVSQAKLSRIENRRALPSPDEVRALAAAYGANQNEADRLAQLAADQAIEFVAQQPPSGPRRASELLGGARPGQLGIGPVLLAVVLSHLVALVLDEAPEQREAVEGSVAAAGRSIASATWRSY